MYWHMYVFLRVCKHLYIYMCARIFVDCAYENVFGVSAPVNMFWSS
mgnify:CR=1 FL=1